MKMRWVGILAAVVLLSGWMGCARRKIRTLSERLDAVKSAVDEHTSRMNALESRSQHLENALSQQLDLSTRIVGRWAGLVVRADSGGSFREEAGATITFQSDGTLTDVQVSGLSRPLRYRIINSSSMLFAYSGGRVQPASNVSLQGNRLSFMLDAPQPVAVILSRQ